MASLDPTVDTILSASAAEQDDDGLAREIHAALRPPGDRGEAPSVGDLLPRVRRLRRGVDDATPTVLREVARADAAGELTMPAYVALTDQLRTARADVVKRALGSVLPPPLRR